MKEYFNLITQRIIFNFKNELISILIFSFFLFIIYFFISKFISLLSKTSKRFVEAERIQTIIKTIKLILRFGFYFILSIFILQQFKININAILTGAGALGAVLILVFQNSLKDIFTGWLFVFEDMFRKNEEVIVNNTFKGKIINFTSRYLILETENESKIFIPFSQISVIENLSRKNNGS